MMLRQPGIFRSYWIAGYEGADHINGKQIAQSLNASNQHDVQLIDDYALLEHFNFKTVRESIGWRLSEITINSIGMRLSIRPESHKAMACRLFGRLCIMVGLKFLTQLGQNLSNQ